MPRTIEVSTSAQQVDKVLKRLQEVKGIVSLARQQGDSLLPPGDILTIQSTNEAARPVLAILEDLDIASEGSICTTSPKSVICGNYQDQLNQEANETIWDEVAFMLRSETNPSFNYLASMTLAGAIAAGGLWTNTLHLIVAGMIVAPAFEPLARLPFGLLVHSTQLVRSGLTSTLWGYLALAGGAIFVTLMLQLWDPKLATDLSNQHWISYWSKVTFSAVLISSFGAIAGAVVIGGQRAVLTTGVMIALALIPSMAVIGMGIATADLALAGQGLIRWAIDVLLVIVFSGVMFGIKKKYLHKHRGALS